MANAKKERKAPQRLNIGERDRFNVTIFADEYASLGLSGDMGLTQAGTAVRALLNVPVPMRRKASGSVSALAQAVKGASDKKRAQIMAILASKDE